MAYETSTTGMAATQTVIGLFRNGKDAQQAVSALRASGFSATQIGAAFRNTSASPYSSESNANTTSTATVRHEAENWWDKLKDAFRTDDSAESRREAMAAPDAGAIEARTTGYRPGESEYEYANEDFAGSLAGSGASANHAAYLSRNLEPGGAIVTVRDVDRIAEADEILSRHGGKVQYDDADTNAIPAASSSYPSGAKPTANSFEDRAPAGSHRSEEPARIDAASSTGQEVTDTVHADDDTERPVYGGKVVDPADARSSAIDRIQLFGEVLRVHKDRVSRGEVRVRKDVVTEEQQVEVPVTREELVLERVNVPNTPAPSARIGQSQEVRVPLSEDRVRVEKQPVVREEVAIGKREVTDVARIDEEVSREELRVDSDVEAPRRAVAGESVEDLRRRG